MDDEVIYSDNDSSYQLPGSYVTSDFSTPAEPVYTTTPSGAGYYDEVTGAWVSDSGGGMQGPLDNTSGTGTVEDYTNVQRFDDGSTLIMDKNGNVIGSTPSTDQINGTVNTYTPSMADTLKNMGSSAVNSIKGFFQKRDAKGNPIPGEYDWAKIAGAGAALYGALGGSKKETGGWQGSIPSYTASREQIKYNDANRRPGEMGRQYFTDVNYSGASTAPQAQGILAAYQPAQPSVNKWAANSTTPALAMPWAKKEVTAPAPAAPAESTFMTPEQKMASLQEPVKAATGRYLRGPTDGMADKINTSIDDKQPAKLSHGEFVVPADVVSHLGNGNSDAGAKKLYSMMDRVRQARTGTKKQGKQINPDKYMPGGSVMKYAKGGIAELPVKKFAGPTGSYVPATDTTTSSTLSPWAGDYVANYLGKGAALANAPYQVYQGPLTAGASDLQQQAFTGASNLASTGYDPTQFTSGTFGTQQAQQYMNPYLKVALDPQLDEMKRRSQINLQPDLAKLTQAGGFGGGRQAIMQSEANRNLLQEQNKTVGQGYATAYDKAMAQFNADQLRNMDAQRASEQSRQYGADYGIKSLNELQESGATQRGITAEGIAADKAQFEEQRDYPFKMVQYQQGLLQGLPISTQTNSQNMSGITQLLSSLGYGGQLYELLNKYSGTPTATAPATTTPTSPGTTANPSSGVTSS